METETHPEMSDLYSDKRVHFSMIYVHQWSYGENTLHDSGMGMILTKCFESSQEQVQLNRYE